MPTTVTVKQIVSISIYMSSNMLNSLSHTILSLRLRAIKYKSYGIEQKKAQLANDLFKEDL